MLRFSALIGLLLVVAFTSGNLALPKRDDALVGKWRGKFPKEAGDKDQVWMFTFDDKGGVKITRADYAWDSTSQTWQGLTAEEIARGDDDKWESENGHLTIMIRERYVANADQHFKYEIEGNKLSLKKAAVYKGKSDALAQTWKMELFDQRAEKNTRTVTMTFTEDGRYFLGQGRYPDTNRYERNGDLLRMFIESRNDQFLCPPDTEYRHISIAGKQLYLSQQETAIEMFKKEKK